MVKVTKSGKEEDISKVTLPDVIIKAIVEIIDN